MAKKKAQEVLNLPVEFSGVSIGTWTASVGVKIDRELCNINTADDAFCGRRLDGRIVVLPNDVDPDQQELFENDRHEVAGVFDVTKFTVAPKAIGARLTFALSEIEVSELAEFAKKTGRLIVASVGEIPSGDDGDES